jgi:hypothetical protein
MQPWSPFTHSRIRCWSTLDVKFSSSKVIRRLWFLMSVSTRSFQGGNTDNDGFHADEHDMYLYIPGSRSVWSLSVLIRLLHGRKPMSTNEQDLCLLRQYPCSYRDWPCTVRDKSVYNPRTPILVYWKYSYRNGPSLHMVTWVATQYLPVYTRNQHGWYSSGTIQEEKLSMFNFLCSLPDGPGRCPVVTRFITDYQGLTNRDDPASHLWMCRRGFML